MKAVFQKLTQMLCREKPAPRPMGEVDLLSEEDVKRVIEAGLATGHKSEKDLVVMIDWARDAALQNLLLEMVLEGKLHLGIRGGDVSFTANPEYVDTEGEDA